tara:strand:- start:12495 stop:13406 length:912 start_codon:yes stop_codon:yes gene_type:complete
MSKILISGASGFVGGNLIKFLLQKKEYDIICISRRKMDYKGNIKQIVKDLTQPFTLDEIKILRSVDFIVHLAGTSKISECSSEPRSSIEKNIQITLNLLEPLRQSKNNLKKILLLSSAESYGPSVKNKEMAECDVKNPINIYGCIKNCIENIFLSYYYNYDLPVAIANTMNTYGPHQSKEKFIPKIIRKIKQGKPVDLHASENPDKRNYLHIDDLCSAITHILKKCKEGERYNVISDNFYDNLEIAKIIANILNMRLSYNLINPTNKTAHHTLSILNGEKLFKTGWAPKINLNDGLKEEINNG